MFVSLRLIALPGGSDREALAAALRAAAADLPGVGSSWIAPVLGEAAINAGDVVWRMTFASERDALSVTRHEAWRTRIAPLLAGAEVTALGYQVTRGDARPAGGGIWRALIFRVMPHGFPAGARELEDGLLLFPKYIPAIRSWALSAVSTVEGPKAFTHVWEQEFDSLRGLTGDYMEHPIHWGLVDAWFDAEYPQYIVDPGLIQVVGEIDQSIMATRA
jgi:hypothetical protein